MSYPTFNINSIKTRLEGDLSQFNKQYDVKIDDLNFYSDSNSLEEMKTNITSLMGRLVKYTEHKDIHEFNYAHDVKKVGENEQKFMWIIRTYIFYQLLAYVSKSLSNVSLYNELYSDKEKYPYRESISNKLESFKMGIFGSITPQSDIDLGIMYTGNPEDVNNVPTLSYVLSRFENIFLKLTGLNSLSFDIETYADMITITKEIEGINQDVFYINTNKILKEDEHKGLVCAMTSVLRSIALAEQELKNIKLDREALERLFENFKFENIINTIHDTEEKIDVKSSEPTLFNKFYQKHNNYLADSQNLEEAKEFVIDYMTLDYDDGRYKYYDYVNEAEKLKFKIMTDINKKAALTSEDISEDISNLIYKIGIALTYRMESYTCSPTIVYIVRILQAEKDKSLKYHTTNPVEYCNSMTKDEAYCTIGRFGFILSCIEQIGNIYRFYKTYCMENNNDVYMCKKKLTKYYGRFKHGNGLIDRIDRQYKLAKIGKRNTNLKALLNPQIHSVSGGKYKKYLNAKNNKKSCNRKSRNRKSRNRKSRNRKSRNRKSRNRKSSNRKSSNRKSRNRKSI